MSFFASVSTILNGLARRYSLEAKLLEHRLRRRWPEVVGEQIAAHTRPDQIRFKKLSLIVENSVWLQQLTFLKPTLLKKINEAAGGEIVSDIVLRVGEIASRDEDVRGSRFEVEHRTSNPELQTTLREEAATLADAVTDPELRARLAEVMANALSARAAGPDPARRQPPS